MTSNRFDAFTRTLSSSLSRRAALRGSGVGLVAGFASLLAARATAQDAPATPADGSTPACVSGSTAENEAVVMRWYDEVLNGRDLDVLDEIVADDAGHDASVQPASENRDGTRQALGATLDAYPDFRVVLEQILSVDDVVVTRWTATGTQEGEFNGYAPTGAPVRFAGINIFRLACGQIAESWSEFDTLAQFGQSLGTSGTTAPAADLAASPAATCAPGTAEQNGEVATRWVEVWNSKDVSVYEEIAHPAIVHGWGQAGDTTSVTALQEQAQIFFLAFPDLVLTIDQVIADGDHVVIRWTQTGTQTGPFFDLEPSGVQATWTGISIFRVQCGQIIESRSETDGLGLREQLLATNAATPAA